MRLSPPPYASGNSVVPRVAIALGPDQSAGVRSQKTADGPQPVYCFPGVAGTGMAPGPSRGPGGTTRGTLLVTGAVALRRGGHLF